MLVSCRGGQMGPVARLRSRMPGWQITATTVGVIIAAGAAAIGKWPHAWWWLIVGTAAVAAAAPLVIAVVAELAQRRRADARAVRTALQGTTGADGSRLPQAAAAELEARVH